MPAFSTVLPLIFAHFSVLTSNETALFFWTFFNVQYLKIRRGKGQVRSDGSRYAVPLIVTKPRKYAPASATKEQALPKTKPLLITGAHDSGKTRWLTRLFDEAQSIWGPKSKAQSKGEPLWLSALRPLSAWSDNKNIANWWEKAEKNSEHIPFNKLPMWRRSEILPLYVEETKAVLFIDDAHKLTGRKLQIARECVLTSTNLRNSQRAKSRESPPTCATIVLRRQTEIIRLDSEVAYDATNILVMWISYWLVAAVLIGFWEAALVLGGIKAARFWPPRCSF